MEEHAYLASLPALSDELLAKIDLGELSPADARRAASQLRILKRLIRHARTEFERENGPIDAEPPLDLL